MPKLANAQSENITVIWRKKKVSNLILLYIENSKQVKDSSKNNANIWREDFKLPMSK